MTESFLDGFHAGSWVSATVVLVGAVLAFRYLPAREESDGIPDDEVHADHDQQSGPAACVDPTDTPLPGGTRTAAPQYAKRRSEVFQLRDVHEKCST